MNTFLKIFYKLFQTLNINNLVPMQSFFNLPQIFSLFYKISNTDYETPCIFVYKTCYPNSIYCFFLSAKSMRIGIKMFLVLKDCRIKISFKYYWMVNKHCKCYLSISIVFSGHKTNLLYYFVRVFLKVISINWFLFVFRNIGIKNS